MTEPGYNIYLFLADLILIFHASFVLFTGVGFILTWIGYFLKWSFVKNVLFRLIHLLCMGFVAGESLTGVFCPLTLWEDQLRHLGGVSGGYEGGFIQHWVHKFLFFNLPTEFFTILYTGFFIVLLLTFWIVRPRWPGRK